MCSVTYENTQLTSPRQLPVFTAIQVNSVIITIGAWVKDNAFFYIIYCRGNSN